MNWFDAIAVLLALFGAVAGHRIGFVARVLSWAGLALGLLLGVHAVPFLLDHIRVPNPSVGLVVVLAAMVGGATAGQMLGLLVSRSVRPVLRMPILHSADRVLGAIAGVVGVIILLWLVLPVLTASPGPIALQVTSSTTAQLIDRRLPPPPDALTALRAALGADAYPDVFAVLRPTPAVGPPPAATGLDTAVSTSVSRSIVKIEGNACDRIQDGSGFVVAPGLVVTNAHVVAGERTTAVLRDDDRRFEATLVAFDPARDLALLRVRGLDRPALPIGPPSTPAGVSGGVFGHPGGAPLRIAPFAVSRSIDAVGLDIYGAARTTRRVLELSATLRPGDSGSALVDPAGRVVGVAFAIAKDRADVAYALAPSELDAVLTSAGEAAVGAGPCLG